MILIATIANFNSLKLYTRIRVPLLFIIIFLTNTKRKSTLDLKRLKTGFEYKNKYSVELNNIRITKINEVLLILKEDD